MTTIKFAKVKNNAVIPSKRQEDAGYDIYACFEEEHIVIKAHETKLIPTGIASVFDRNYAFVLKERGSTGTKGIGQRCGVIDSGFRGEWFVPITNHNHKPLIIVKNMGKSTIDALKDDYIIYPYEKAICQAVLLELPESEVEEMSYEELKKAESERGERALGSSEK